MAKSGAAAAYTEQPRAQPTATLLAEDDGGLEYADAASAARPPPRAHPDNAAYTRTVNSLMVKLLHCRVAELEWALGNAHQRLVEIEQSTIWRATAVLRSVLRHLPSWLRVALRRVVRVAWWVLTPHRTVERFNFLHERLRAKLVRHSAAARPTAGHHRPSEQTDDLAVALRSLRQVTRSDLVIRHEFETTASQLFFREWRRAAAIARQGGLADAQQVVRQACDTISSVITVAERLPRRPIRSVAIVGIHSVPQCRLYRVEQKADHLRAAGFAVAVYDSDTQVPRFLSEIYKYDAVIFYRVPAFPNIIFAINKANELGLTTFYDMDDMIFDAAYYPPALESFGGLVSIDEYVDNALGTVVFRHAMSLCDFGIASTTPLAPEMARLVATGQVFVHRNAFGERHVRLAPPVLVARTRKPITIFYGSGTKAHKEDFQELIEPALVEMVTRYGERVRIVLVGYIAPSERLASIADNLELIGGISEVEQYWSLLRSADINLAVLKPGLLADCKSEIKWIEAAMFGVPSIVSGTDTYREVIEPGVTGLVCDSAQEWVEALDLLIRDGALRRRIGLAAWRRVQTSYGLAAMADNITGILDQASETTVPVDKPTVLIVHVVYPPQTIGGATRVVHDNVTLLAAAYQDDFHVEVFTTVEAASDCELSCYVQDGVRVTAIARPAQSDLLVEDDRVALHFAEFVDRVRPSLIHFHCVQRLTVSVVDVARTNNIPYVITVHDGFWISEHQFVIDETNTPRLFNYADPLSVMAERGKPPYDRMMRLQPALFGAARVIAVSEKFAELHRGCGVPRVMAVENGISDLPAVNRSPAIGSRVRLAIIGGTTRHKGFDLVKSALSSRAFTNLRLAVIDYAMKPGDHRVETWNTTQVDFLPKVPEARVAELYADIDVLLAPSVWPESFGLVTREALYCGCWVIASDRGSVSDCVVEGQNGHIVDVGDTDDLIRVLTLIDRNPERYRQPVRPQPTLRRVRDQVDDLAGLYRSLIQSAERQDSRSKISPAALA
jgi:glycosyltransferase involved in cell wall biosynthesis